MRNVGWFLSPTLGNDSVFTRKTRRSIAQQEIPNPNLQIPNPKGVPGVTIRATSHESMALGPGVRLGPYEVIAAVGAGGMGEGLSRPRYQAQSRRRAEGSPGDVRRRSRSSRALSSRGAGARVSQSSD